MLYSILVVEDDPSIQAFLNEVLVKQGYAVHISDDGVSALENIKKIQPDLVILDLGLPKISGEAVCSEIREKYPQLHVIILSAKDDMTDVIQGLNLGADDYLTKPFETEELLARIKSQLKRLTATKDLMMIADLELNNQTSEVKRNSKPIQLSPQEFSLLQCLMANKGQILTREMILNRIWQNAPDIATRVVDVYIGYLRRKIDKGHSKKLLHSVRGFGYTMKE